MKEILSFKEDEINFILVALDNLLLMKEGSKV
jgi:hypothetical protein